MSERRTDPVSAATSDRGRLVYGFGIGILLQNGKVLEMGRAAQAELERAVGRSGVPRRFLDRTFENYLAATPGQRQALEVCRAYADGFEETRRRGGGLMLLGGPGTGKTHLACAILARVIRAGRHLLQLIDGILDLSKIEAGKLELVVESFDLDELLDDVLETVSPMAVSEMPDTLFWSSDSLLALFFQVRPRSTETL